MEAIKFSKFLDTGNSTNTLLDADATFTGVTRKVADYVLVSVHIVSDNPSATDGVHIQHSNDGETWDDCDCKTLVYDTVVEKYTGVFIVLISNTFMRIVYDNGTEDQIYFKLQTFFDKYLNFDTRVTPLSAIPDTQQSLTVRMVSDYKKDVAMGLIEYSEAKTINGIREEGFDDSGPNYIVSGITDNSTYNFPTIARRLRIKAGGDAQDLFSTGTGALAVLISGLNSEYEDISEPIYLTGASASSWTTQTFLRVNSMAVVASGSSSHNVGTIIIESETDLYELCGIEPGISRSQSSVFTTSKGHASVLPRVMIHCDSSHSATIEGYFREYTTQTNYLITKIFGFSGMMETKPEEHTLFNEKTDFWITAVKTSGTGNAKVSVIYDLDVLDRSNA